MDGLNSIAILAQAISVQVVVGHARGQVPVSFCTSVRRGRGLMPRRGWIAAPMGGYISSAVLVPCLRSGLQQGRTAKVFQSARASEARTSVWWSAQSAPS